MHQRCHCGMWPCKPSSCGKSNWLLFISNSITRSSESLGKESSLVFGVFFVHSTVTSYYFIYHSSATAQLKWKVSLCCVLNTRVYFFVCNYPLMQLSSFFSEERLNYKVIVLWTYPSAMGMSSKVWSLSLRVWVLVSTVIVTLSPKLLKAVRFSIQIFRLLSPLCVPMYRNPFNFGITCRILIDWNS